MRATSFPQHRHGAACDLFAPGRLLELRYEPDNTAHHDWAIALYMRNNKRGWVAFEHAELLDCVRALNPEFIGFAQIPWPAELQMKAPGAAWGGVVPTGLEHAIEGDIVCRSAEDASNVSDAHTNTRTHARARTHTHTYTHKHTHT